MKIPSLCLLLLALTGAAFAAPIPAPSSITAVTVYADRAVVTRSGHLDLPVGQSDVTFTGLPAELSDQSLQVAGHGTDATILDVNARVVYTEATPDPRVLAAETELDALKHQDDLLKNKLAVLVQQRALLTRIETAATQPLPKDSTAPRAPLDDWQKLLGFSSDNTARIAAESLSIDGDRTALARKITAAQAQLDDLRGQLSAPRATKTVTVHLAAPQAGPLDLTLTYALAGAGWSPSYDTRLRADDHTLALTYFGVVRNATGEDWTNVALTLSTARPNLGGDAPAISPWIVDVNTRPRRPAPNATLLGANGYSGGVTITAGTLQVFNSASLNDSNGTMDAYTNERAAKTSALAVTTLDSAVTSASFKIPAAATILSDNTPQKVGIATATLDARLQYEAAPKLLETAYLDAYAANTTDYPLLAGPVSTFLDDAFVATSQLKTVMPGEKFSLAFGADEGIAIQRKLVRRFTETTGFTGKSKRITYEYLITLTNHKRAAERVVFKDAAPVSRNEKIIVKLLAPAERDLLKPEDAAAQPPKPGVSRDSDGVLLWRLDLNPGEKREVPLKFSVEYPADLEVDGLE